MAHTVSIPLSFEFRRAPIDWVAGRAHVIGWRNNKHVEGDTCLWAEFSNSGTPEQFGFPVEWLPEDLRTRCLAILGKRGADKGVKELCSGLELPHFSHSDKPLLDPSELRTHSREADAWQLRDEFLRLDVDDAEATLSFLKKWGRWRQFPNSVDLTQIASLQRRVRQALTSPPEDWFASRWASPPAPHDRSTTFPFFKIVTDSCESAICMTTTIDLLRELKFETCARPDCGVPFRVESKHERRYCTHACAHLESVRRKRKEAVRAAKKPVRLKMTGTSDLE